MNAFITATFADYFRPSMQEPDFSRTRARFDPTVNLGHILTALMMGAALVTMWANMKVSQSEHEARLRSLEMSQVEMKDTISKIADNAAVSTRTQDRLSLTLEYLTKQAKTP